MFLKFVKSFSSGSYGNGMSAIKGNINKNQKTNKQNQSKTKYKHKISVKETILFFYGNMNKDIKSKTRKKKESSVIKNEINE